MTPEPAQQAVCFRCGTFLTELSESRLIEARLFCPACAARPEVDYLEAFRLKYWGKRDLWAWSIGLGTISSGALTIGYLIKGHYASAVICLFTLVVGVAFFFGKPWARWGLIGSLLFNAVVTAIFQSPNVSPAFAFGTATGLMIIPLVIVLAILNDTRNRLFFKLEVTRPRLKKAWDLYANNSIARAGFLLAMFSLLAFPIAPIALLLSVLGLRQVNPAAHPPIGRRRQAIAGITLSVCSMLIGGAVLLSSLRR